MDYDSMTREDLICAVRQLEGFIAHQDKVLANKDQMIAVMRKSRVIPKPDKSQSEGTVFPPRATSISTATAAPIQPDLTIMVTPIRDVFEDESVFVEGTCVNDAYGDEPATVSDLEAMLANLCKRHVSTTQAKNPPQIVFDYVSAKDYHPEPNSNQGGNVYDEIVCANNRAYFEECRRKYPQFYGGRVSLWDRFTGRIKDWWDDFRHKSEAVPDYDDEEAG